MMTSRGARVFQEIILFRTFLSCKNSSISQKAFIHLSSVTNQLTKESSHVAPWLSTNGRLSWATKEVGRWMKSYEDFVGITEVKEAQTKVVDAERKFVELQELRRQKQNDLQIIQFRLKEIHSEMDKVSRGEDRFYELFNKEHAIIKEEKELVKSLEQMERDEKHFFLLFSAAIRETHEKERVHSERTKYWPIVGSFITFVGASIYGIYRFHKLQSILSETPHAKFEEMTNKLGSALSDQHSMLSGFVADLKGLLGQGGDGDEGTTAESQSSSLLAARNGDDEQAVVVMLEEIRAREVGLSHDIEDVKRMIASGRTTQDPETGNIVYVGPEVGALLDENSRRLEFKIKAGALATVISVYAGLALTIPILYSIFKGS